MLGAIGKVVVIIVGLLVVMGLFGYFGYRSAITARLNNYYAQLNDQSTAQYKLALQDLNNHNLATARQRLEYIINNNPDFPGAADKLAQVMVQQALERTPTTMSATVEVTSTPDTRGADPMFAQAQQLVQQQKWGDAYQILQALLNQYPDYKPVDVDGLFYITLRNRGIAKMLGGDLEGGTYDVALAGQYGPVDQQALDYVNWVNNYLLGSSYWGWAWDQVINHMKPVADALPAMRDGSGITSSERLRQAYIQYGNQLVTNGKYCDARNAYAEAMAISQDNNLAPTATAVWLKCVGPSKTPTPLITMTPTLETTVATTEPPPPATETLPPSTETPAP